ncbi:CHAP domain-containing protein [Ktedonosporobacter rubrisoli]|uniref:CHAP domain-containing protein n=1 Tax=Ktedonosporobacter rubrisoli TaxID=2509675 RepID=A0A4P6JUB8_KTERU|nr:CHAP domain-containing protein [Ktedonosporobacter rubrisoli]QBD79217.1 CHAP domain-containing protein [Ktedonosporobacter rubrisoli]
MPLKDYYKPDTSEQDVAPQTSDPMTPHPDIEQLPFPGQSAAPGGSSEASPAQYPGAPAGSQPLMNPMQAPIQGAPQSFVDPTVGNPAVPQGTTAQPTIVFVASPNVTRALQDPNASPNVTRALVDPNAAPNVTRVLTTAELQTGTLPDGRRNTTSLRQPVVIKGSGKKSQMVPPPKGRRLVVHVAVTTLLLFIVLGTLIIVVPTGNANVGNFSIFKPITNLVNSQGNNTALITSQAATATAVTQDGFDPGGVSFVGVPAAPPGQTDGGLGHFFYGQCTYFANMHYHDLTGVWVSWLGNANQWASGAANAGWTVSGTPKVYSIIVLQAGVQGAGWYGHVAVVEHINSDGSVLTSNWNWAGNWARTTYVTFRPGPGVSFIWAPGH